MRGFIHSLMLHGNKALSIGDSKPLMCRAVFSVYPAFLFIRMYGGHPKKVSLISKVIMTSICVNFVMKSLHVWSFSTSSFLDCTQKLSKFEVVLKMGVFI